MDHPVANTSGDVGGGAFSRAPRHGRLGSILHIISAVDAGAVSIPRGSGTEKYDPPKFP